MRTTVLHSHRMSKNCTIQNKTQSNFHADEVRNSSSSCYVPLGTQKCTNACSCSDTMSSSTNFRSSSAHTTSKGIAELKTPMKNFGIQTLTMVMEQKTQTRAATKSVTRDRSLLVPTPQWRSSSITQLLPTNGLSSCMILQEPSQHHRNHLAVRAMVRALGLSSQRPI